MEERMDFLPKKTLKATLVQDGENGNFQTNRETHRTEGRAVTSAETFRVKLAPGGCACIFLEKEPGVPETPTEQNGS